MEATSAQADGKPESRAAALGPLLMAADAYFATPLATALRSIAESNSRAWPIEVHILHERMDEPTRKKVEASMPEGSVAFRWHPFDISTFARDYSTLTHISKMTFARLLLPRYLPESCDRALYLDGDILVLGDLRPLWETGLDGAVVGAVRDRLNGGAMDDLDKSCGLRVERYFNAGVLLIDVARWRDERVSERALEYLDRFPNTRYADQDALNAICDRCWKELDPRWNYQCVPLQPIAQAADADAFSIVHFVASVKPWQVGNLSPNVAFYNRFRSRTRFTRSLPEYIRHIWKRSGYKLLERSPLINQVWYAIKASVGGGRSSLSPAAVRRQAKRKRARHPMRQS